jgi:hypothetical protein
MPLSWMKLERFAKEARTMPLSHKEQKELSRLKVRLSNGKATPADRQRLLELKQIDKPFNAMPAKPKSQ